MAPFEALLVAFLGRIRRRHWTSLAVIMVSLATVAAATSGGTGKAPVPAALVAAPAPTNAAPAGSAAAAVAAPAAPAPRFRSEVFDSTVTRDLRYGRAPDAAGHPQDLLLDLYQPRDDSAPERPAIVWAHGGAFAFGDKSYIPASTLAARYARMGYVTVSIDYRLLAPQACGGTGVVSSACFAAASAAADDAKAAVRWLRAHAATYRIDVNRIAFGGDSAGGVLATAVGVQPERQGNSGNPGYSDRVQAWMAFSGGVPGGIFVDRGDAPGLLIHGTADDVVPYSFAADTAAALRRSGVPVELVPLPGAGHDPWTRYQDLVVDRTTDFFYRYLHLDSFSGFTG